MLKIFVFDTSSPRVNNWWQSEVRDQSSINESTTVNFKNRCVFQLHTRSHGVLPTSEPFAIRFSTSSRIGASPRALSKHGNNDRFLSPLRRRYNF